MGFLRLLIAAAPLQCASPFLEIMFFGSSLAFALVYLWSRHNPGMQIRQGEGRENRLPDIRDGTGEGPIAQPSATRSLTFCC